MITKNDSDKNVLSQATALADEPRPSEYAPKPLSVRENLILMVKVALGGGIIALALWLIEAVRD